MVGARIIVAPDARSAISRSWRQAPGRSTPSGPGGDRRRRRRPRSTLQELQRRHELLAVLKCYGTVPPDPGGPPGAGLAVGEVIVAEAGGQPRPGPGRWFGRGAGTSAGWRSIRGQRKELKAHRRLPDKEIRLLQVGGSARLATYGRRVFQYGFHGAHADELAAADEGAATTGAADHGAGPAEPSRGAVRGRMRAATWIIAALVVLIGSRGIIGGRLPAVGQFTPFPGWAASVVPVRREVGTPPGVGTTAPASSGPGPHPGWSGTVLLGAMGLTQKVLVFALRPPRGVGGGPTPPAVRLAACLPGGRAGLPGRGRPLRRRGPGALGGPGGLRRVPLGPGPPVPGHRDGAVLRAAAAGGGGARSATVVALGLLEAVLVSFVPAAAVVVLLAALALLLSSCIGGDWRSTGPCRVGGGGLHGGGGGPVPAMAHRRPVGRGRGGDGLRRARSRHPRRRRGGRSCASPPDRSATHPWPGASPPPRWCP